MSRADLLGLLQALDAVLDLHEGLLLRVVEEHREHPRDEKVGFAGWIGGVVPHDFYLDALLLDLTAEQKRRGVGGA